MSYTIYGVHNTVNNKIYVGSTTNWPERKRSHIKTLRGLLKTPTLLYLAGRKYPENCFEFFALEKGDDISKIFKREEFYILKLNTIGEGYNISLPSEQGNTYKGLIERKKKMLHKVPWNLKSISPEEWVARRKENPTFSVQKRTGLRRKETLLKPVVKVHPVTYECIEQFPSILSAAKQCKAKQDSISKAARSNSTYPDKFRVIKGFLWFYANCYDKLKIVVVFTKKEEVKKSRKPKVRNYKKAPEDIIPYSERNIRREPITLHNVQDGITKTFRSITEASTFLGCNKVKIFQLKKGYQNKGGGRLSKITNIKGWVLA